MYMYFKLKTVCCYLNVSGIFAACDTAILGKKKIQVKVVPTGVEPITF